MPLPYAMMVAPLPAIAPALCVRCARRGGAWLCIHAYMLATLVAMHARRVPAALCMHACSCMYHVLLSTYCTLLTTLYVSCDLLLHPYSLLPATTAYYSLLPPRLTTHFSLLTAHYLLPDRQAERGKARLRRRPE